MRYEDFALQLETNPEGDCTVRVIRSPAGEGQGRFEPKSDLVELSRMTAGIAGDLERNRTRLWEAGREVKHAGLPTLDERVRALGHRLFQDVFSGPVRSRYDQSLGEIRLRPETGLRIRLQMDLNDPTLAGLHNLPWEYLFRGEDGAFLALERRSSIVRSVSLPLAGDRPSPNLPLRILVVTSQPKDLPPLHLEIEKQELKRAWEAQRNIEVAFLSRATLEDLREKLLTQDFHGLHFMGHGGFASDTSEGILFFEDDLRRAVPVRGSALSHQLRDFSSLRLVFLNACQTACAASSNPFAGVSTALLQAGVPAVIAMQFPISDQAALAFSEIVYRRLAQGDPVDAAVAEGRLAIHRRFPDSLEWGTPVLFLRAIDDLVFPTVPVSNRSNLNRRTPRLVAGLILPLGLGILSVSAWPWTRNQNRQPVELTGRAPVRPESVLGTNPQTKYGRNLSKEPHSLPAASGGSDSSEKESTESFQPGSVEERPEIRTSQGAYELIDGHPLLLREIGATAAADFLEIEGQALVRVSLTPNGSSTLQQPPFLGPKTLIFPAVTGNYCLDILTIDFQGRRLTLRSRFEAPADGEQVSEELGNNF